MQLAKLKTGTLSAVTILTMIINIYSVISQSTTSFLIHGSGIISYHEIRPLHVEGRHIRDDLGNKVILRGAWKGVSFLEGCVSTFAFEGEDFEDLTARTIWRPNAVHDVLQRMKEWGFNSYAEQIWGDWWIYNCQCLLGEPRTEITTDTKYRDAIKSLLTVAQEEGLYVQIRVYSPEAGWGGVGEGRVEAPFPAGPYTHDGHIFPNAAAFADFWYDVAYELAGYLNVVFCLYDEPSIDQDTWFDAAELCIQRIRQAEQDAGGYTHIILNHQYYCGDCLWMEDWINEERPTANIVFSNHIYHEDGTFQGHPREETDDLDWVRNYMASEQPWNDGLGYKYIVDTYNVPIMVTAIGAASGETDDTEYNCFVNVLTVLNEWEIGYWGFLWYVADVEWRMINDRYSRAPASANRVGQALMDAIASGVAP